MTEYTVTPERLEQIITGENYWTPEGSTLTVCVLTLANGFTVTGESACADPAKYDIELGREYARAAAVSRIWPLEGYLLRQRLHDLSSLAADAKDAPENAACCASLTTEELRAVLDSVADGPRPGIFKGQKIEAVWVDEVPEPVEASVDFNDEDECAKVSEHGIYTIACMIGKRTTAPDDGMIRSASGVPFMRKKQDEAATAPKSGMAILMQQEARRVGKTHRARVEAALLGAFLAGVVRGRTTDVDNRADYHAAQARVAEDLDRIFKG